MDKTRRQRKLQSYKIVLAARSLKRKNATKLKNRATSWRTACWLLSEKRSKANWHGFGKD